MSLTIKTKEFNNYLKLLSDIINNNNTNVMLNNVLLYSENGNTIMIGSNTFITCQITIPSDVISFSSSDQFHFLVEFKLFYDLLSKLTTNDIKIDFVDTNVISITAGKFSSTLNTIDFNNYPHYDFSTTNRVPFSLSAEIFKTVNDKLIKLTDIKKLVVGKMYEGVLFDASTTPSLLQIVGSDTNALGYYKFSFNNGIQFRLIFDSNAIKVITSQLKTADLQCYLLNDKMIIQNDNIKYITRFIEGDYPNVVPKLVNGISESKFSLEVDKYDLINAIERAQIIISNDTSTSRSKYIKLIISKDIISINSANIEKGSTSESISITNNTNSTQLDVMFDISNILNILKNIGSTKILVRYNSANEKFYFVDSNNKDSLYIILPIRI